MTRFITFLRARGRILLAATALLMLGSFAGIVQLRINTDFSVFMPPVSSFSAAQARVNEAFGAGEEMLFLVDVGAEGKETDAAFALAAAAGAVPGVAEVQPPAGERLLVQDGTAFAPVAVRVEPGPEQRATVNELLALARGAPREVIVTGEPYLTSAVFDYILQILVTIPPVVILLVLLVFRLRLGSMRATVLSIVPAVIGAVITLGALAWIQGQISIVSVLVPIFVIVLGSADGLHITSHVIDHLPEGAGRLPRGEARERVREAVTSTLGAVGGPVIMTTVTTMVGFLSMLLINSAAIRELGVAAAAGVLIAGIVTWTVLPAVILHQRPLRPRRRAAGEAIERAVLSLRGWPSVVIAVALIAAFVPGALRLRANFSMIDVYKPSTEVRRNIDRSAEILGGSIPVSVVYDVPDATDSNLAAAVLEFESRLRDAGVAGETLSAFTMIRGAWEEASGSVGYPSSRTVVRAILTRMRLTNRDAVERLLVEETGRSVVFLRDLDEETIREFLDIAHQVSDEYGVELSPVGSVFVMQEMNDQIMPQQIRSLLLAAGLVLLITAVTQRSLWLGVAASVPILITLVTLFGIMGYARIDLSVITGMMSGLTVGVGIDYAIHYVSLYRQSRDRGEADPAVRAIRYVSTPVLANALGLAVGFTAMVLSPLSIHVTLAILMWTTMLVSAFLSLTLLPTLTRR